MLRQKPVWSNPAGSQPDAILATRCIRQQRRDRLTAAPPNQRTPRRPREVGEKPTRSRHCKRGVRSQGPSGPSLRPPAWPWEDRERHVDPRVRKPDRPGASLFGAQDAGRSLDAITSLVPLDALGICPSSLHCQSFAAGRHRWRAQAATLSGRLVDPEGRAVTNAQVVVTSGLGAVAETRSGPSGEFEFRQLPDGRYDVRVVLEGFQARLRP